MDPFYRALSRQEVKCQALPPGRQRACGWPGTPLTPTWELPRKHSPHRAMSMWQLSGQSESSNVEKSAHHTFYLWFSTAAWTGGKAAPQGTSFCNELLATADTQRDRKRPKTKQFTASLTFPTWKGCSVRSGSYQDRYLGTSYHIYPALEYPLRMLTNSFPPPCVQGIIHCSPSPTGPPALILLNTLT